LLNLLTTSNTVSYGCKNNESVNLLSSKSLEFNVSGTLTLH